MKKYISLLLGLVLILISITGCGTNSLETENAENTAETKDSIVGYWQYTGTNDEGMDVEVNIEINEDDTFDLLYVVSSQDSFGDITGDYTLENESSDQSKGDLVITVTEVTDDNKLFIDDVKVDSDLTLSYFITDDDNMLNVTGLQKIISNIPDEINFARGE